MRKNIGRVYALIVIIIPINDGPHIFFFFSVCTRSWVRASRHSFPLFTSSSARFFFRSCRASLQFTLLQQIFGYDPIYIWHVYSFVISNTLVFHTVVVVFVFVLSLKKKKKKIFFLYLFYSHKVITNFQ